MKTLAVMCMELHSTRPSFTPLLRTICSTCGVMFSKAILDGMLNVRYSVNDFMATPSRDGDGHGLFHLDEIGMGHLHGDAMVARVEVDGSVFRQCGIAVSGQPEQTAERRDRAGL